MDSDFFDIAARGAPVANLSALNRFAKETLQAVQLNPAYKLVDMVRLQLHKGLADVLIVDCESDAIPTKNKPGIWYAERLALVFYDDETELPEVWALRRGFPLTPHQNGVLEGEPASLCLNIDSWDEVRLSWTPENHLQRILWWLVETANERLHRDDQPLEQLFFVAHCELILPPDFNRCGISPDNLLQLQPIPRSDGKIKAFKCNVVARAAYTALSTGISLSAVCITIPAVTHGVVERTPSTLGSLERQLQARGSSVIAPLTEEIIRLAGDNGMTKVEQESALLVIRIPLRRADDQQPESYQTVGYFLPDCGVGMLGEAIGVLFYHSEKYFAVSLIGGDIAQKDAWKDLSIEQVKVVEGLTVSRARTYSGIASDSADFSGMLIGVGALGSNLLDHWTRSGWGYWSICDEDSVKPHNIVRHIARSGQVGMYKADCVRAILEATYTTGVITINSFPEVLSENSSEGLRSAVQEADLIVDASTSLAVPRLLSRDDCIKRAASIFLTPSGRGAVLMMEDAVRIFRLDIIEAQYYRSVIREVWGENHLIDNHSHLYVGAGCRETTFVLASEDIQSHAAILSRQLRMLRSQPQAVARAWTSNNDGSVNAHEIALAAPLIERRAAWRIVWDEEVRNSLAEMRAKSLPCETGGVLLGYADQIGKVIYVVDALKPPPDSQESRESFLRGTEGLSNELKKISALTGGIVSYVGEWHSHPDGIAALPSGDDIRQIAFIASHLRQDGVPGVMLIVGKKEQHFVLGEMLCGDIDSVESSTCV